MSTDDALRECLARACGDAAVVRAVSSTAWRKVDARSASFAGLKHAEALRRRAARIREHTFANLSHYLREFAAQVVRRGGRLHFAPDASTAARTICDIARQHGLRRAVKAKSMTSEEIGLNDALGAMGVEVTETDLGEFVVQLDHDRPSHILAPMIHKDRASVGRTLARALGCAKTSDPDTLVRIARDHLRQVFRRCDLGITGVNFAVAESGTLCLLDNEGNARLSVSRPRVHVALMGIEKIVPRMVDLAVFLKLIARSTTGQPLGSYTSLINGPRRPDDPDGPEALHVVLVDNGRSDILGGPAPEAMHCIRCGACLNACPVYRNVGGHAYGAVYPGPIGSILSPLLDRAAHRGLPRVSTLCGACHCVCPVDIDLPNLLVRLRRYYPGAAPRSTRRWLRWWAWMMRSAPRYRLGQRLLAQLLAVAPDGWAERAPGPLKRWTWSRDLPRPQRSFRQHWAEALRHEQ